MKPISDMPTMMSSGSTNQGRLSGLIPTLSAKRSEPKTTNGLMTSPAIEPIAM